MITGDTLWMRNTIFAISLLLCYVGPRVFSFAYTCILFPSSFSSYLSGGEVLLLVHWHGHHVGRSILFQCMYCKDNNSVTFTYFIRNHSNIVTLHIYRKFHQG